MSTEEEEGMSSYFQLGEGDEGNYASSSYPENIQMEVNVGAIQPQEKLISGLADKPNDADETIDLDKLLESCLGGSFEVSTSTAEPSTSKDSSQQIYYVQQSGDGTQTISLAPSTSGEFTTPGSTPLLSIPGEHHGSQQVSICLPGGQGASGMQQIVIPLEVGQGTNQELQAGNTVLLPVIPTLMPDGVIEMRLATNALQHAQVLSGSSGGGQQQFVLANPGQGGKDLKYVLVGPNGAPSEEKVEPEERSQGQQIYKCKYCDYSNSKRYLLVRHMKSHSEDRPFKCSVCERSFKTNSSLQNHVNTHTGTKPFKCKMCASAFTTSGEMVRHMRYIHTKEKPHKCSECEYATVELSKLKRHMRSHTGERPFKCTVCSYSSPDMYKLKRHMRTHTGERPYECETCLARFSQSNSLKAHRLIHTPDEKPTFQCQFCPTTCGRKTDLKLHIQKQHTSEQPIQCAKCTESFPDKWTWKQHQKSHEGQKCFTCPHCDYSAFSQRHLEQHVMVHANQKAFQCPETGCGKCFRQQSQLRRHTNLKHNPTYTPRPTEKSHVCTVCQKKFRHLANLNKHIPLHAQPQRDPSDEPWMGEEERSLVVDVDRPESSGSSSHKESPPKRRVLVHIKRTKPRPEDLGLTNVRLKGRPRKAIRRKGIPAHIGALEQEADEDEEEELDPNRTVEISKEVESAFGFTELAQSDSDAKQEPPKSPLDEIERSDPDIEEAQADLIRTRLDPDPSRGAIFSEDTQQ